MKTNEERIIRDVQVCGGEPVFTGTNVTLRTVLASLAAGSSAREILSDFPGLKPEDIQAAIAFAASSAEARYLIADYPKVRVRRPQVRP